MGYRFTERLRRDLEVLDLQSLPAAPAPRVYVLSQTPSEECGRLAALLRNKGAQVDQDCVDGPAVWSRSPSMDDALVPSRVIKAIVTWLARDPR